MINDRFAIKYIIIIIIIIAAAAFVHVCVAREPGGLQSKESQIVRHD